MTKEIKLIEKQNVIPYLSFPALEETGIVRHLFTTRKGGVSTGYQSSLNLNYNQGNEPEAVDENYRRVADALGGDVSQIVCSQQTHTTNVQRVGLQDAGRGVVKPLDVTDIDGMVTNEPGIVLATFYADCVPLFFVDPVKKCIGLSHSGWKGTVGRMGEKTIQKMTEEYGTDPSDVIAAIGPSICQECYEVSEDVAKQFLDEFGNSSYCNNPEMIAYRNRSKEPEVKYQLNLWEANRIVLLEAGVQADNIHSSNLCTCCNSELLFSHRASNGKRGNLGAFLGLL